MFNSNRNQWLCYKIAAQNNAIKTVYIKAEIDNTQKNSKCRLCSDRDETAKYKKNSWVDKHGQERLPTGNYAKD